MRKLLHNSYFLLNINWNQPTEKKTHPVNFSGTDSVRNPNINTTVVNGDVLYCLKPVVGLDVFVCFSGRPIH